VLISRNLPFVRDTTPPSRQNGNPRPAEARPLEERSHFKNPVPEGRRSVAIRNAACAVRTWVTNLVQDIGGARVGWGGADVGEERRQQTTIGAKMMGGEIGRRGEKNLRVMAKLGVEEAVKRPENGRTNPSGGNWARCVTHYLDSGWGGTRSWIGA
jgi:hypothetical protein